eukprot:3889245-Ditylum_brightwellii.AAC.1
MLPAAVLPALQTLHVIGAIPGFGTRRVAPASDDGAALPWWQWQWDDCVPLWVILGGLEVSVGTASCVFGWTWLAADNADSADDDDGAYDTKNGVNAVFHHHPP